VLFLGLGILGLILTPGFDDSIGGRIISGAMTVALFYLGFGDFAFCVVSTDHSGTTGRHVQDE
jgi:hypothetical protein